MKTVTQLKRRLQRLLTIALVTLMAFPATAVYAENAWRETAPDTKNLQVPVYKSRLVQLDGPAKKVSIGNPEIADILIMKSDQLYILGKSIGTTNVLIWDKQERLVDSVNVDVTYDLGKLKSTMHRLLPDEPIEIHGAQNSILLSGSVSDAVKMDAARRIAESFLREAGEGSDRSSGTVVNLLQVGGAQQVMLEVKVAEIRREELRRFNVDFFGLDNNGNWKLGGVSGGATFPDARFQPNDTRVPLFGGNPLGPVIDEFMPNDAAIDDKGLFASFLSGEFAATAVLEVAKSNGLAKILAEPTLTTLTGREAEFLAGGEFPIPVPDADRGITIQFKEFGVGVKFLPVVLDGNRINLNLNISVSELVNTNNVAIQPLGTSSSLVVPALAKRSAQSTVELADGQTIGIAGLISENLREQADRFPGLSNLPILGHMFRSQEWIEGETELLILVTPRLAKALPAGRTRLPTDSFIEPTETEFYLHGRLEGRGGGAIETGATDAGGAEGTFGHSID